MTMHDITPDTFTTPCDFCGADTTSIKQYDQFKHSHWLVPIDGSGSDHLAIWCKDCGPKHKEDEQGDRIKQNWNEAKDDFMTLEEFEDIFEDRDPFEFI